MADRGSVRPSVEEKGAHEGLSKKIGPFNITMKAPDMMRYLRHKHVFLFICLLINHF